MAAAGDAQVSGELELVYERISREVAARQPRCDASGRCCHFEAWGHRLYVTGLEAAYLVMRLERPVGAEDIRQAREAGGCPFQKGLLCSVHSLRPLGCRVYYCDPTAGDWQQDLSERMLREIRSIHERHQLAYRYGEWRGILEMLLGAGS
ncbi:MAG: YkgJ family cysteine cluster protein [Phycisphaerales bacterium]|nr:YkgJ family cysteine cluster protein [Phycisphaerales bacterium]